MIDKNTFCSSPWMHFRLTWSGDFVTCRWGLSGENMISEEKRLNIRTASIVEYFNSPAMTNIRQMLLDGKKPLECRTCYYEETFGKVSGRKKQLLRSKLDNMETFNRDFTSSPYYDNFEYSRVNHGKTNLSPFDLQIDLENTCNGSCIHCHPIASSKLATDYKKLFKIEPSLFPKFPEVKNWSSDPVLVRRLVEELIQLPYIEYIHFLGGETLFVESFYTICEALIEAGVAKNIMIGTTTNSTIYSDRLEKIIPEFKTFYLGVSIESVNSFNDYNRYPAKIENVLVNLNKFLDLRNKFPSIHLTLRITPNIFSIFYFDEVIQFMIDNHVMAESCNILKDPSVLRMELLPDDIKKQTIDKLVAVALKNSLVREQPISLIRDKSLTKEVTSNIVYQYIDFLTDMKAPEDVENERFNLVKFLKAFESLRNNSILDYAPEFTEFLKKYGY